MERIPAFWKPIRLDSSCALSTRVPSWVVNVRRGTIGGYSSGILHVTVILPPTPPKVVLLQDLQTLSQVYEADERVTALRCLLTTGDDDCVPWMAQFDQIMEHNVDHLTDGALGKTGQMVEYYYLHNGQWR
jgi:hypothetical protein